MPISSGLLRSPHAADRGTGRSRTCDAEVMSQVYRDWAIVLVDGEPTEHKVLLAGRSAEEIEIAVLVEMLGLNVDESRISLLAVDAPLGDDGK